MDLYCVYSFVLQISFLGVGCSCVSIFERFRTPAWRPYRAGMFVAMGLSAVLPVLHGLKIYGFKQMQDRMGMTWMVLEGFLYILGAGLYAVSYPFHVIDTSDVDFHRHAGPRGPGQEHSIFGEVPIKSSICLFLQLLHRTCTAS